MKIRNTETNEISNVNVFDYRTKTDCTLDLIAYDPEVAYNYDECIHEANTATIEWWQEYAEKANRLSELEATLDLPDEYYADTTGYDMGDDIDVKLRWIKENIEA